jgi:hypothetical protein
MPAYVQSSPLSPMLAIQKGQLGYSWGLRANVAIAASPAGLVRSVQNGVVVVTLNTLAAVAHLFQAGQELTITGAQSVLGTIFDGGYLIASIPSASSAVLIPLNPVLMHQSADTGGGGNANSIQYEQPALLSLGKAFALSNFPISDNPAGFSADGVFNGAPGAFELDVQVAEVDAPANYQTIAGGNITAVDATNNTFHLDAPTAGARFVAAFLRSRANGVGLIVSFRR